MIEVTLHINGKAITDLIDPSMTLLEFVRKHGCYSVKCGCETTNCGLCTVFVDDVPILSCSQLAVRTVGKEVVTLEGLQQEAKEFIDFIANQGADQCGFCNPGMAMNTIAMLREIPDPTEQEIKEYLAGNLCRCSGYEGQLRGILDYLRYRKESSAGRESERD